MQRDGSAISCYALRQRYRASYCWPICSGAGTSRRWAGEGLALPRRPPRRRGTQYSRAVAIEPIGLGVLGRPVKPGDDGVVCDDSHTSMLGHHAPFGDDGLAHLPGVLRAGDFVDLDGNFLADEILELRGLGVAAGDELERLGAGFEIAQPVRRRQPARFAGDLVGGGGALALLAALHGVEFTGQDVAGIDRLAG